MTEGWRPDGYSTVSPYLVVEGAQRLIDFLVEVFDGEPLRRYEMPDGSIMHAEVRVGDSVIMLGEAGGEWAPVPAMVHVYVQDVDATYRRAIEAGAEPIQAPERNENDPDRRGGVKGPGGVSWWIGTQQ